MNLHLIRLHATMPWLLFGAALVPALLAACVHLLISAVEREAAPRQGADRQGPPAAQAPAASIPDSHLAFIVVP